VRTCKLCPAPVPPRRTSGLCPTCQKRRNNRARAVRERGRRCRTCGARVPGGGRCRDCFLLARQIRQAHAGEAAGPPVEGQAERERLLAERAAAKPPLPLFDRPRPREACRAY
jgi:NMD protein affecting ribosome stability and mRNA decay